jgi:hypothetical protein
MSESYYSMINIRDSLSCEKSGNKIRFDDVKKTLFYQSIALININSRIVFICKHFKKRVLSH